MVEMDTLDRLITKEFLIYFAITLLSLSALFLGIDFIVNLTNSGARVDDLILSYSYKVPATLYQFTPVACLMTTLLIITTMSRQNEILALYSGGIGKRRILSTFVSLVVVISALSFLFFDALVPALNRRMDLIKKGLNPDTQDWFTHLKGGFWYRSGTVIYNVGRFLPESSELEDIQVYVLTPKFEIAERIHAARAFFRYEDWELEDGYSIDYQTPDRFPKVTPFKTRRAIIPDKPQDLKTLKIEEDKMRLRDLRLLIQRNQSYGLDTTIQKVTYHERLALIFTPLILVLIGIPFTLRPLKIQTPAKSIAFAFFIVFIYLILFRISLSIGKAGHIPPLLAGWSPNILFLILSGLLLKKSEV